MLWNRFAVFLGYSPNSTLGWVNLYQQFEIEKYTVCGKLILPKKMERHFLNLVFSQLACEFAWICEYLQAFKDMQSKI